MNATAPTSTLKIQPYQRVLHKLLTEVPQGYKARFVRGRDRYHVIAAAEGKPTLIYRDGSWNRFNAPSR